MRSALLLTLAALLVLCTAPSAWAHGDGPAHYLELESLYPSFTPAPSPAVELELMGYVEAAKQAGYPIKVGIANEGDVTERPEMLKDAQRYTERVVRVISGATVIEAPVLIVTPYGVGLSGKGERKGRSRTITTKSARTLLRGVELPARAGSDDMARTAMVAMRQISEAGGHPLPARITPARVAVPLASTTSSPGGDSGGWLQYAAPLAVLALVGLFFEVRSRTSRKFNPRRETA